MSQSGLNVFSTLGIIFIVLKILGYVSWSWWVVLAPFYIGWALVFMLILLVAIATGVSDS